MKLWEGRFAAPTAADADKFNESLSFDKKLYKADITASLAHSEMLGRCNIISEEDKTAIQEGLKSVLSDIESGKLKTNWSPASATPGSACIRRGAATIRSPPISVFTRALPRPKFSACLKN